MAMKTYCVVTRTGNYTIQAEDVFVVDSHFALFEKSLQIALAIGRPVSVRVPWGWVTHHDRYLPLHIGGMTMHRVAPISHFI
jgi:hypothetical protein